MKDNLAENNPPSEPASILGQQLTQLLKPYAGNAAAARELAQTAAEVFPQMRTAFLDAAQVIYIKSRQSPRSNESNVVRKLQQGCTTVEELCEELHLDESDVQTALERLIMIDRVEMRTTRDGRHRSGRGGTKLYYFLINAAAFAEVIGKPESHYSQFGAEAAA